MDFIMERRKKNPNIYPVRKWSFKHIFGHGNQEGEQKYIAYYEH